MARADRNKLILVGLLLVGAAAVYWFFIRDSGPLPDRVKFVCVATGKTYSLSRDDVPSILPATNPDTGQATLLPSVERDGRLYVSERFRGELKNLTEVNRHVDPKTLEVRQAP